MRAPAIYNLLFFRLQAFKHSPPSCKYMVQALVAT